MVMPEMPFERHNLHALVIDNNRIHAAQAQVLLASLGITSDVAATGQMGLQMVRELTNRHDFVLLDMTDRDREGFMASQVLVTLTDVPIFAYASPTQSHDWTYEHIRRCGVTEIMTAPVTLDQLRGVLQSWMGSGARRAIQIQRASKDTDRLPAVKPSKTKRVDPGIGDATQES